VYTREAHPGEHVGHHDTVEGKRSNARLLRDEIGIRRPILLDDLAGTGHLAYGGLPNMTWVIARGGRVIYKADWTSAANVEGFLQRYRGARDARKPGVGMSPYTTEQIEYRDSDREAFYARLQRNGPRALAEFKTAEQIWAAR
jgi:hypothetical protein